MASFAAIDTLTATLVIDADDGSASTKQVTYRRPGHWRIEDDAGLLVVHTPQQHVARGTDGKLRSFPNEKVWYPEAEIGFLCWGHPDVLLGAEPVVPDPALDPPQLTEVAGRAVRREIFSMSRKRCTVFTDLQSGLILSQSTRLTSRSTNNVYTATVTQLQLDGPIEDDAFAPVPEHQLSAVNRTAETQAEIRANGHCSSGEPQVVAAVLRDGDRVLLCHRSPSRRWFPNVWDLPGGHVEPGEYPAAALVRELGEELGITIREPSDPPLTMISMDDFDVWVWLLDSWDGTVRNTAPDEHDELAWVDLDGLASRLMADPLYLPLLTDVLSH